MAVAGVSRASENRGLNVRCLDIQGLGAIAVPASNVATYALASTPPIQSDARMRLIINEVANDPAVATVVVYVFWSDYENSMSADDLKASLQKLNDAGKNVYVLNDVPAFSFPAMDCVYGLSPFAIN